MRKFNIPLGPYFDLFVHDGFIQAIPHTTDRKIRTFGRYFKLVENQGDFEVVEIPIAQSMESFYPEDISRVGFSVNGISNEDSIYLTLRTWPQRSAADNSGLIRIRCIYGSCDKSDTMWSVSKYRDHFLKKIQIS